jgi:predicted DNA-binding transcriptional regulator YafY
MAEHIYMFAGESVAVKFRAAKGIVSEIIDWFGSDVSFSNDTGETVDVRVTANEQAMVYWALQYGQYVEVLEPVGLRERVRDTAVAMVEKYGG